jgi:hypothetical protein
LLPPEQIKVEMPMKVVYDFTKRSHNMRLVNEGKFEDFEFTERCDSKIEEGDLAKLEIELKKKQKRRIKREERALMNQNFRVNG